MKAEIKVPTGNVIGIGKLKIFTTKIFSHNIPTLSFIVSYNGDRYTASCLHLLLDASAKSDIDAVQRLSKVCEDYVIRLFEQGEESAWNQLHELFTADCISEFWNAYRDVQLNLAERGITTESSEIKTLQKMVEMYQEEINRLQNSEDSKLKIDVVSYERIEEAA